MAFRFKINEDTETGFQRIAGEQVERAVKCYALTDRATAVHETRKCLKRLRALLRLVRPALSSDEARKENTVIRDVARTLSVSRDAHVMLETIDWLKSDCEPAEAAGLNELRAIVASRMPAEAALPVPKKTSRNLRQIGKRLSALKFQQTGIKLVSAGFEMTYRKARRLMAETAQDNDVETSHEWRKFVQAHWRQLSLLSASWPAFFDARIALAKSLSDMLGQSHDVAVTQTFLHGCADDVLSQDTVDRLSSLMDRRQHALHDVAYSHGSLLFADRPAELCRSVESYWATAVASHKSGIRPPPLTVRQQLRRAAERPHPGKEGKKEVNAKAAGGQSGAGKKRAGARAG